MRRVALILIAAGLFGSVVIPSAEARLSPPVRRRISRLVNRFVKDVVLRRNLVEGWALAGPNLRGGTTRSAWLSGQGVTALAFPAVGNDFRHAWDGHLVSPTRAELTVT